MVHALPDTPLLIDLPPNAFEVRDIGGKRMVYAVASIDDGIPDYQNELIAIDALWDSKDYFLDRGIIDIGHWACLPNPVTGRPDLDYIIGSPAGARKDKYKGKPAIFVKAEIFNPHTTPPEGSSGERAERFWHSIALQNPPQKWYPSVYGSILGAEIIQNKDGTLSRRITGVRWSGLAFHTQVQHKNVPAVSLEPMGPFQGEGDTMAKAVQMVHSIGGLSMSLGTLAKAMTAGIPVVEPLTQPSIDTDIKKNVAKYKTLTVQAKVIELIEQGDLPMEETAILKALKRFGLSDAEAKKVSKKILSTPT